MHPRPSLPILEYTSQRLLGGGEERWLEPGTEYYKRLPLDKSWYKGLDLGGLDAEGSKGGEPAQGALTTRQSSSLIA